VRRAVPEPLAGRRVLVLLDNASNAEQVRPLLPGSPSCMAVVTSRDALAGLVARDGAWRLDLDLLRPAEAAGLLRALIGERARADPDATTALATLCARLPLALRVAAALAAASPGVALADIAAELADQQHRLDALDAAGDSRTAIQAVFSWSVRHLDDDAARTFRFLGLHPGPGHLADAAMHSHACRAAAQTGDPAAEASALINLGAALMVQGHLRQAARRLEQARHLYRETGDRIGEACALVNLGVAGYCRGRYEHAASCERQALALYRQTGNRVGEARALSNLGAVYLRQGRYQQAHGNFRRSLELFREGGVQPAEAHVLGNLGELEMRQGRYAQAKGHLRRSLALCRAAGHRLCEARAQACLGLVMLRQGHDTQAIGHLERALALHTEVGNPSGRAEALNGLGEAHLAVGQGDHARARHADALALAIQAGDHYEQARAHNGLASACLAIGDCEQASRHWQQALTRYAYLRAPEAEQVRAVMAAAQCKSRARVAGH